jgi:hypothetical protein
MGLLQYGVPSPDPFFFFLVNSCFGSAITLLSASFTPPHYVATAMIAYIRVAFFIPLSAVTLVPHWGPLDILAPGHPDDFPSWMQYRCHMGGLQ